MNNYTEFYKAKTTKEKIIFETTKNVFINFNDNNDYLKGFWLPKKLLSVSEYTLNVSVSFPDSFTDLNYIELKRNKKGEYDPKKVNSEYTEIKRIVLKGEKLTNYLKSIGFNVD